jgi:hypothetical protein
MKTTLLYALAAMLFCVSIALSQDAGRGAPSGANRGGPAARGNQSGRGQGAEIVRQAIEWGRDKMPNLAALAETRRPRFTTVIVNHYRTFQSVGPNVKEHLLKNYAEEDRIYGLVIQLENAPPEERDAIREKIIADTRKALQSNLDERANRIAKLKKDLATQEAQLSADRQNMEKILARQLNRFNININALAPTTGPTTQISPEADTPPGDTLAEPAP